ncbi:TOMM precursor leader peptide-binding protein [Kitasatospora paracochleata]|uniref:Ribosomal protein S12 methylthiotransferase accessory factor n=1 Tax=Kitasatospora paracochleata TaxID=58354 RepID=A0ABT1IWA9_9ACTN|nr:TOMM precursor leader peptide-binding protein [Kitasatospora paracochleata]MCP2309429.1 ribosomal protein S12 methylthiotransferase accessory factor [Kitasatospora paracochleata]
MSSTVIGDGLLAAAVARRPPEVLVVARDGWDTGDWAAAHDLGRPWLPVWTELGRVVVGPLVRPGEPGCVWCLQKWRSSAPRREQWTGELRGHDRIAAEPSHWLSDFAAETVRELVHAGAAEDCCWFLDLRDLSLARHAFLPDPLCQVCGALPDDTAARAELTLRSRPKPRAGASRIGDLSESRLTALYVDAETGVVAPPTGLSGSLFPLAEAVLAEYGYRGEAGFGRTSDFAACRATAVAEAMERLGGQWAWGKRTTVRGSYAELAKDALDPRSLGLFPPERYQQPDCTYQPFTEDAVTDWVWAYSFREARPVLVPETYAYYRTDWRPGAEPDKPFTFEISNGCALGGCLEEAILHGILEVVERDAFLMTWYARLPLPEVDLARAPDPRVGLVVERIERAGYRVRAFDMTLAEGIPAFWVLAQDTTGDTTRPKVLCTSGSALDPVSGVLTALRELAPIVEQEVRRYPAEAERARKMAADPDLVRVMSDHALCSATQEAFDRFDFLLSGNRVVGWEELGRRPWPLHTDLRDDLTEAVGRMLAGGMDVVVVDQTSPLHEAAGLHCVKVIAPGALPMTFGQQNRRTTGLPRLLTVPHRLGHAPHPLTEADLNPHPHPFP